MVSEKKESRRVQHPYRICSRGGRLCRRLRGLYGDFHTLPLNTEAVFFCWFILFWQ